MAFLLYPMVGSCISVSWCLAWVLRKLRWLVCCPHPTLPHGGGSLSVGTGAACSSNSDSAIRQPLSNLPPFCPLPLWGRAGVGLVAVRAVVFRLPCRRSGIHARHRYRWPYGRPASVDESAIGNSHEIATPSPTLPRCGRCASCEGGGIFHGNFTSSASGHGCALSRRR